MNITYRDLRNWKYELVKDYSLQTSIGGVEFHNDFIELKFDGILTIAKGYCWDGPSGPTIDTKNTMRASLVHDVFYQMIRLEVLAPVRREAVDRFFHSLLRKDGMSRFRAWYFFRSVRIFGGSSIAPEAAKPYKTAP